MPARRTNLADALEKRRRELKMPVTALARRAGVGLRTAQRILSGETDSANLGSLNALADALGIALRAEPSTTVRAVRLAAAQSKAKRLAALVQGTSALEDQAVDGETLREIEERLTYELLAGSQRQLWND
jgi:transcriptional regulator with XRE-family HTH domain